MEKFDKFEAFMIAFRFIEINHQRCQALDLVDLLSGMEIDAHGQPWDAGTAQDFEQAIADLRASKINMAKFRTNPSGDA
ncbi:hypothetical protein LJR090_004822 [Bosea sp. LjRoot90]|uniref:hypothetical protein n=1 Tax=Bosea sp. LjRoot90 TaxID=3342342 RepID=UPI003ED0E929